MAVAYSRPDFTLECWISHGLSLCCGFFNSGYLGNVTLTDITGIPAHWFAFAFTVVALAAFWGAMFIEKRIREKYNRI